MLRSGRHIRLTKEEAQSLTLLTGASPEGVRTVEGLNRFIDLHRSVYSDETSEEKLLKHLLMSQEIED
jgi:hypothetical protein